MSQLIYQGTPNALPYTFDYTPDNDSEIILYFSGSAWSPGADYKIGLTLEINQIDVVHSQIYSNAASVHRALVAGLVQYKFPMTVTNGKINSVSITIKKLNANTNFDANDFVSICIL